MLQFIGMYTPKSCDLVVYHSRGSCNSAGIINEVVAILQVSYTSELQFCRYHPPGSCNSAGVEGERYFWGNGELG